jgi:predicted dehydrogenase
MVTLSYTTSAKLRHTMCFITWIRSDVHLYAAPGPDRDKFLALIGASNPTSWVVETPGDGDSAAQLEALLSDGVATMVVLAGKNDSKMTTIARLTAAGIHCLGDKPWSHP